MADNRLELRDELRFVAKHADTPLRRYWAESMYKLSAVYTDSEMLPISSLAGRYLPNGKA